MYRLLFAGGAFALATFLGGTALLSSLPRPVTITLVSTVGTEQPLDDAIHENGWNVLNADNAPIKDVYLRFRAFLGEPVTSFDGRCQGFRFGRLCTDPGKPEDWRVEVANAGWEDMQLEGFTPKPGSSPHPAVRDWKLQQLEAGADLTRLVGRTISDPVCDRKSHQCRQWADKQLFLFPDDAVSGEKVQRAPLGLWLHYPDSRAAATAPSELLPSSSPVPSLVIAGVLALVGLAILSFSNYSSRSAAI